MGNGQECPGWGLFAEQCIGVFHEGLKRGDGALQVHPVHHEVVRGESDKENFSDGGCAVDGQHLVAKVGRKECRLVGGGVPSDGDGVFGGDRREGVGAEALVSDPGVDAHKKLSDADQEFGELPHLLEFVICLQSTKGLGLGVLDELMNLFHGVLVGVSDREGNEDFFTGGFFTTDHQPCSDVVKGHEDLSEDAVVEALVEAWVSFNGFCGSESEVGDEADFSSSRAALFNALEGVGDVNAQAGGHRTVIAHGPSQEVIDEDAVAGEGPCCEHGDLP